MAALQIDAINTVIRSHYMPLYSRLGHYDRQLLDARVFHPAGQSAHRRSFFEYWGHECSVLPLALHPLLRWRMNDAKQGVGVYRQLQELAARKPAYIKSMRREVEQRGPSTSRELATTGRGKGMWEWSESKQALEYLFCTGELSSAGRRGFERLYAATEQVIPDTILNAESPSRADAQASLIETSARALGVATESDLRDYFRMSAKDATTALAQLVEDKRLQPVAVEGWEKTAYVMADVKIPRTNGIAALLTPFDPLVWHRERTERLFSFHYRIEIYVPKAQRKYGYYVLPFLVDDQLGARVDLKADRENNQLIVHGAWSEQGVKITDLAEKLGKALIDLALWLGLDKVTVKRRGDLSAALRGATH